MKRSQLGNRFPKDKIQRTWGEDDTCGFCQKFGWDHIHHILSPSSWGYKKGSFNKSLLNSCPIHSVCHLYNPMLHKREKEKELLMLTLKRLIKKRYKFTKIDREFFENYHNMYKGLTGD